MIISNEQVLLMMVYVASISMSCVSAIAVLLVRGTRIEGAEAQLYIWGKYFLAMVMLLVGISNSALLYDGWGGHVGLVEVYSAQLLLCGSLASGMITFLALAMMRSKFVTLRNVIRYITPGIAMAVICMVAEYVGDGAKIYDTHEFWNSISHPEYWLRLAYAILFLVQTVIYLVIFHRERKIYLSRVKDYFSDMAHLELRGVTWTFYVMQVLSFATMGLAAAPTIWSDMVLTLIVGVVLVALCICYINYRYTLGCLQRALELLTEDEVKESPVNLTLEGISARLEEYMLDKSSFADSGVVISDVATAVGMNPRELSAYINRTYGVNFNAWVNAIRINAAKNLICEDSSRPLSEIALAVGFSDLSVFSRAFKRHEELSPSAFRNRCRAGIE